MNGFLTGVIILSVSGLLLFIGLKASQDKKGKLVYACLILWSAYMALANQYHWDPLNTVTFRTVLLSPVSHFMERHIFHMPANE